MEAITEVFLKNNPVELVDPLKIGEKIAALESQIETLSLDLQLLPDGPKRPEMQRAMRSDIAKLEEEAATARAELEALMGPPPVKYSAVARMRLKDGTMGGAAQQTDDDGRKIEMDQILPPMSGLMNAVISVAVIAAAIFALAPK